MTIEQERAKSALLEVEKLESETEVFKQRYRSYVDRLGPAIVMNGLGQALAVELAAAGPEPEKPDARAHRRLYENVKGWLCRDGGVYPSGSDLLRSVMDHDESFYMRAQTEALAWLEWHKKFCRAYLPDSGGGGDE